MMAQTQLPGNMGVIDWTGWARGIVAAFIGGGAGAVQVGFSTMVVDPKDFNAYTGKIYLVMLVSFVFSGLMAMMAFLHNQPIPAIVAKTESVKTEPDGTVTTRHKEVTVPQPPASPAKEQPDK